MFQLIEQTRERCSGMGVVEKFPKELLLLMLFRDVFMHCARLIASNR